jgi:undecaprenyl diphosphate synthase
MIKHVAFIMDGNRRWAKERGLPSLTGHAKGYQRIEPLVTYAKDVGIKHITFWAFSTENWKRNEKEVAYLMSLFRKLLKGTLLKNIIKNGGRICVLGELDPFPQDIKDNIKKVLEESKDNTDIIINIGLNYGGRSEILHAVQKIISEKKNSSEITEEIFSQYLYTHDQPDPDLIIRTGGEQRLSGFLPWQGVYSELYFPDIYWPDFSEKEFDKALEEFAARERRFGK